MRSRVDDSDDLQSAAGFRMRGEADARNVLMRMRNVGLGSRVHLPDEACSIVLKAISELSCRPIEPTCSICGHLVLVYVSLPKISQQNS